MIANPAVLDPVPVLHRQFDGAAQQRVGLVTIDEVVSGFIVGCSHTSNEPDRLAGSQTLAGSLSWIIRTSAAPEPLLGGQSGTVVTQQGAGAVVPSAERTPIMLAGVKRLTAWRWDRVAAALGCTRQAVHGWMNGKETKQENFERLAKLYATLSYIDRGNSEENRALLATASVDGLTVGELLDAGKFDVVRRMLGKGAGRKDELWTRMAYDNLAKDRHWLTDINVTADRAAADIAPPEPTRSINLRRV